MTGRAFVLHSSNVGDPPIRKRNPTKRSIGWDVKTVPAGIKNVCVGHKGKVNYTCDMCK